MSGRVAILLATYQGERFLDQQLCSYLAQTDQDWVLYWRDDGSTDATLSMLEGFGRGPALGRVTRVGTQGGRLGASGSFMRLLGAALQAEPAGDAFAFSDQDDIWLPEKLARARRALDAVPPPTPALYCARQVLVDQAGRKLGLSPLVRRPGFPAALAQNVATGCTAMLNRAAAELIVGTEPPPGSMHDWWCYLLVAAADGRIIADPEPVVLYRQHAANAIGAPAGLAPRAAAALRRGSGAFMDLFRAHVAALEAHSELLTPQARAELAAIRRALAQGSFARAAVLRMPGLRRQTWYETLLFRCWFLLG